MNKKLRFLSKWDGRVSIVASIISITSTIIGIGKYLLGRFIFKELKGEVWIWKYISNELIWALIYFGILVNLCIAWINSEDKDPFLPYYLVFIPVGVGLLWLTLQLDDQRQLLFPFNDN